MTAGFPSHPAQDLVEAFWHMMESIHLFGGYGNTYGLIAAAAVKEIDGCDAASVSTLESTGPVSHAITGTLSAQADQVQFQEGEGPCLDTAMRERWTYTPVMDGTGRWPTSNQRLADELGVRSMFSCRLALGSAPEATLGGLGFYSLSPDAFSEADQLLAILLSSVTALLVNAARQHRNLEGAVATRQAIGEAIGILRTQSNVTSEQAFQMLVAASMRTNVKLRDVARQIAGQPDLSDPTLTED
jgi:transcriptional regulator with GAF, ATPase, and Fis domain